MRECRPLQEKDECRGLNEFAPVIGWSNYADKNRVQLREMHLKLICLDH